MVEAARRTVEPAHSRGARLEPQRERAQPDACSADDLKDVLTAQRVRAFWVIDVEGGGLRLLPVGDHDVQGQSPDPGHVDLPRATFNGPNGEHRPAPSLKRVW